MKVAIVHDYLNQYGGAERVLETLHEMFPQAPIYTATYQPKKLPTRFQAYDVRPTSAQKMPFLGRLSKMYSIFYPLAFESIDFSAYELVISSSSNFAKGIITRAGTTHICYCHTVPHFLYHYPTETNRRKYKFLKPMLMLADNYLRLWDYQAAQRVDYFIANSKETASRIQKYYRKSAEVIYPPVDLSALKSDDQADEKITIKLPDQYFLIVSRLVAYKNIDRAIRVFNELKLPLIIAGDGKEKNNLQKIANQNITFLGKVSDSVLPKLYAKAQALILPGSEDFGIVPVEAMGFGTPVIALASESGVIESVIPNVTGILYHHDSHNELLKAVQSFKEHEFDPKKCQAQAAQFSKQIFIEKMRNVIQKALAKS